MQYADASVTPILPQHSGTAFTYFSSVIGLHPAPIEVTGKIPTHYLDHENYSLLTTGINVG